MFSNEEKEYLQTLLKRELENFRKAKKIPGDLEASLAFLKAMHDYDHFLERLLEKIK
jgi:hypothetical protein